MKILLGDFDAMVGRQIIFKLTFGNESLHQHRKLCHIKKYSCQQHNVTTPKHKYSLTSPDGKTLNQIDHILINRRWASSVLDVRIFRGADRDTDRYGSDLYDLKSLEICMH